MTILCFERSSFQSINLTSQQNLSAIFRLVFIFIRLDKENPFVVPLSSHMFLRFTASGQWFHKQLCFYRQIEQFLLFRKSRLVATGRESENNFIISMSRAVSPHHSPTNLFFASNCRNVFLHVLPNSREHHDPIIISSTESEKAPWKCNGTKSKFIVSLSRRRSVGCSHLNRLQRPNFARSDPPSVASDIAFMLQGSDEHEKWPKGCSTTIKIPFRQHP